MRFGTIFAVVVATVVGFVAAAEEMATTATANPLHAPLADAKIKAGEPYTITWFVAISAARQSSLTNPRCRSPNAGSQVTLVLRKGEAGSLDTLEIIASTSLSPAPPSPPSPPSR